MADWYYQTNGDEHGPISSREIVDRIRAMQITGNTMIRKGDSRWVQASEVDGLFEAATNASVRYLCPYCAFDVSKPPTTCEGCDRYLNDAEVVLPSIPRRMHDAAKDSVKTEKKSFREWATSWIKK